MRPLTKLLAVAVLSGTALVGSASAQYPTFRPGLPASPSLTLPHGVKPVPTTPPSVVLATPGILPGGCYPPRPLPPPVIDIDYKVFYRTCSHDRWRYYTTVESGREARRLERYLESLGYQVDVVEKFDHAHDRHDGHRH